MTTDDGEVALDSLSTCSDDEMTPDDVLLKLGKWHRYLITRISIACFIVCLSCMHTLVVAFTNSSCDNCTEMTTLIEEFDLKGDRAYLSETATTSFMLGNMIGGIAVGLVADRYGRRPVIFVCMFLMSIFGVTSAFSPSIFVFSILRFFQGIFYTGTLLTCWVLSYELSSLHTRFFTTVFLGFTWVAGYGLVTPLAYFSPTWRYLIFFVSAPTIFYSFIFVLLVPESLHFLVQMKKDKQITEWLLKVDRKGDHGVGFTSPSMIVHTKIPQERAGALLKDIWKHKHFLVYVVIMVYLFIVNTFIYFGLSLFSTSIAGNIYVNYMLLGLAEAPSYYLGPWWMNRYGRRVVIGGSNIVAAIVFFLLIAIPDGGMASLSLWMIGKFAVSVSFMGIYVYSNEIFPTNIRNLSIGFCETMSRIGAILAPFISTLSRINTNLPSLAFAATSMVAGLSVLLLPETLNEPLPSTVHEAASRKRK